MHYTAPDPGGISALDACRQAGITYRQLDYWIRRGLVAPSVRPGHGSGSPRRFSEADVELLRVLGVLFALGCGGRAIERAALELADELTRPAAGSWVMVDADGSAIRLSADDIATWATLTARPAWVIPLEPAAASQAVAS